MCVCVHSDPKSVDQNQVCDHWHLLLPLPSSPTPAARLPTNLCKVRTQHTLLDMLNTQ